MLEIGNNGSKYVNKKFSWKNSNRTLTKILKGKQSNKINYITKFAKKLYEYN